MWGDWQASIYRLALILSSDVSRDWQAIISRLSFNFFFLCLQGEWQTTIFSEEEIYLQPETTVSLGKITEQKGILGPGPPELRFSEAL